MKTKLIIWIAGLAAMAVGFALRVHLADGPYMLIALCALLVLSFVGGFAVVTSESSKFAKFSGCANFFFLGALLGLIGFVL